MTTALNNRTGPFIINEITKIHEKLRKQGLKQKLHMIDNGVSEDLTQYF